jgi:hypothetical protein
MAELRIPASYPGGEAVALGRRPPWPTMLPAASLTPTWLGRNSCPCCGGCGTSSCKTPPCCSRGSRGCVSGGSPSSKIPPSRPSGPGRRRRDAACGQSGGLSGRASPGERRFHGGASAGMVRGPGGGSPSVRELEERFGSRW